MTQEHRDLQLGRAYRVKTECESRGAALKHRREDYGRRLRANDALEVQNLDFAQTATSTSAAFSLNSPSRTRRQFS